MKPISPISRPRRPGNALRPLASKQPLTDWNFQPIAPNLRGGSVPFHPGVRRPSIHRLSQEFFSAEANRESRFEGWAFAMIVALAAWPIGLAIQAAAILAN